MFIVHLSKEFCNLIGWLIVLYMLLEKFWRISLYVTEDTIAKLYVT